MSVIIDSMGKQDLEYWIEERELFTFEFYRWYGLEIRNFFWGRNSRIDNNYSI